MILVNMILVNMILVKMILVKMILVKMILVKMILVNMILVKKRNRSKKKFLRLFLIFENNAWNNNVFTPAVLN